MRITLFCCLTLMAFGRWSCYEICDTQNQTCAGGQFAVVKDLSDQSDCSIGLLLSSGDLLIPELRVYVQQPTQDEDPAYYFEFIPGDSVYITYRNIELTQGCQIGQSVFLTCINTASITSID